MFARDILQLLKDKHCDDVFVDELTVDHHYRMDAWAMTKSWRHPYVAGYEIKVGRSDFLKDNKWIKYLDHCNSFYFVCPLKLIDPTELPEEAGLIYVTKNGKRLYTKKKAPYRNIKIPRDTYKRILMSHKISKENRSIDNQTYWTNWLEDKNAKRKLGYSVGARMQKLFREKVTETEDKNRALQNDIARLKNIIELLDSWHIDWRHWDYQKNIKEAVELCTRVDSRDLMILKNAKQSMDRLLKNLEHNN
jgi:hypothetical protein